MKITPSNELKHIIRILDSCENLLHLQSVEQMFKNFKSKWIKKIDSQEMIEYMIHFNHELERKKNKL